MDKPHASRASKILNMASEKKDTLNNFQSDFNVDFNIQQSLLELPATCEQDD